MTVALRRVLLIHDYPGLGGGAEILVQDIAAGLRSRGIDARILVSSAGRPGDARADWVFHGTTGHLRALPEVFNPSAVRTLGRALEAFDPDVVHLGMFLTQASPAILPLLTDRPTLWWTNEYRSICPTGTRLLPDRSPCRESPGVPCVQHGCMSVRGMIPRWLQLRLLERWRDVIDRTLVPSRAMEEAMAELGWRVDGVLPHGAGHPTVLRDLAPHPRVAYAGRLVRAKGVDVLVRAFALAGPDRVDATLELLGDGPEGPALRSLTRELGITDRVHFAGHVSRAEVQRRLASAWVQCVPSIWPEPYGLVTVEAQRRGTVVVASRAGAQPELIRDGETGFLVPPGDPEALAECLRRLWSGGVDLSAIGDAGRVSADRDHDFQSTLTALMAHYRAICEPGAS